MTYFDHLGFSLQRGQIRKGDGYKTHYLQNHEVTETLKVKEIRHDQTLSANLASNDDVGSDPLLTYPPLPFNEKADGVI